jgi:hypothetical protein
VKLRLALMKEILQIAYYIALLIRLHIRYAVQETSLHKSNTPVTLKSTSKKKYFSYILTFSILLFFI